MEENTYITHWMMMSPIDMVALCLDESSPSKVPNVLPSLTRRGYLTVSLKKIVMRFYFRGVVSVKEGMRVNA